MALAAHRALEAVVPTLGASPHLGACLEALAADGVTAIVVHQGDAVLPVEAAWVEAQGHRLIWLAANRGFAAATNRGLAASSGELVATVNDDAVVEPGWAAALIAALEAAPQAAAAQGSNLRLTGAGPELLDGRGLAWNRWWQAVQIGRGEPPPAASEPQEVFGVSATAAVYRRRALAAVAGGSGEVFDERLEAYYEDADLACRLQAAGWRALWVPAARARHAGSVTGDRRPLWRTSRLYGNRWAVAARCFGRGFPVRVPRMALRDLADLAGRLVRLDARGAAGIVAGWVRALRLLPGSLHRGEGVR